MTQLLGATRRTLQGFTDAIGEAVRGIAYEGKPEPKVFLYARPGNLPSVKVTVEVHVPVETATVVMESRDEQLQYSHCLHCQGVFGFRRPEGGICPWCKKSIEEPAKP